MLQNRDAEYSIKAFILIRQCGQISLRQMQAGGPSGFHQPCGFLADVAGNVLHNGIPGQYPRIDITGMNLRAVAGKVELERMGDPAGGIQHHIMGRNKIRAPFVFIRPAPPGFRQIINQLVAAGIGIHKKTGNIRMCWHGQDSF
ncbi:hypothetical protein D3C87_1616330 [compost metagenome]